jgi:hypothetical protein
MWGCGHRDAAAAEIADVYRGCIVRTCSADVYRGCIVRTCIEGRVLSIVRLLCLSWFCACCIWVGTWGRASVAGWRLIAVMVIPRVVYVCGAVKVRAPAGLPHLIRPSALRATLQGRGAGRGRRVLFSCLLSGERFCVCDCVCDCAYGCFCERLCGATGLRGGTGWRGGCDCFYRIEPL